MFHPYTFPHTILLSTTTMRRRITLIHSNADEVSVKDITSSSLVFDAGVNGAVEEKYSWSSTSGSYISQLRVQINRAHELDHKLHNWSVPFAYSYQYGLHVYAQPNSAGIEHQKLFYDDVNVILKDLLGMAVQPGNWIQSLNSLYYHSSEIPALSNLPSHSVVADLWTSLDYVQTSDSTTLKLFNPNTTFTSYDVSDILEYAEVGVFTVEAHSSRDEVILSGVRVILNENNESSDPKIQRTVFHTKPRHRYLSAPSANILIDPKGLHPVLSISLIPQAPADHDIDTCKLFAYLTLNKSVFFDKYQIPENVTILAQHGTKDLELPAYSLEEWGTELLLELDSASDLDLTLHSRYQLPNKSASNVTETIDKAVLFYACDAISDSHIISQSAFDNKQNIGGSFEGFFTDDCVFYHLSDRGTLPVEIPTLEGSATMINLATTAALIFGIFIVLSSVFTRFQRKKEKTE
ncbi:hypothetical protein PUMCH_004599 [Australozyma saopauloensis]|uniref:Protein PBN1 n=1 Tax=Australozyma saopauloensis TaxID=291208 RepID=A0AAX4HH25_9ASCO|nr:hypothetical protein PUMCH_004599 [[Candida] saopauloensis]